MREFILYGNGEKIILTIPDEHEHLIGKIPLYEIIQIIEKDKEEKLKGDLNGNKRVY